MTAGHGGRKRSEVDQLPRLNRPITAKGPGIGRFGRQSHTKETEDNGFRPETVPFTNIGPLGNTEPVDGDEKLQQEIQNIQIPDIDSKDGSDHQDDGAEASAQKYNEPERKVDDLSDDQEHNQNDQEDNEENEHQSNIIKLYN